MRQIDPRLRPAVMPALRRLTWSAALTSALLAATIGAARAEGRLSAKYSLTVAGVEIGRASITVDAGDTAYQVIGTGKVTGIMRAVSAGKGSAAARGAITVNKLAPQIYALSAEADGKAESVRLAMVAGTAKEVDVEPPIKPLPDRVEVTETHLANIMDPVSGAFVYVPGTADLLSAAACDRSIPIFDGRQRYDVSLTFLRIEQVKAGKTYAGPAVVCRAGYTPVAGHRPTRSTVKYMMENKEMYVWLVPIAGTRLLAPFRVSIATMIGTATLEATSFEAEAKDKAVPISAPKP
ncbi:DUF3108 domain-containing protein [Azorhizobium sp. AG788]|uniref:DUF3108 domain-containing protein n=1 Tax=Azorhizobium sp. AG788 TaxID=2183897 RepID=UPI00313A407F